MSIRILLIFFVFLTSCSNKRDELIRKFGHPFDSISHQLELNTGIWKVQYSDSTHKSGDSLMYYENDTLAKVIPFTEVNRIGFVDIFDSLGNWASRIDYALDTQTIGVRVAYPETGLINYNYHLIDNKPIGVYRQFYNYYHDSVFFNGYVYPRSTHLKEYRLYDINSNIWFKQEYYEDQTIKFDSGHSIIPMIDGRPHYTNERQDVLIWIASPREVEEQIIVRNDQTGIMDTLLSSFGEVTYTFTPNSDGYHRFTVFHNLMDTTTATIRKDSVTYRLNIINKNGS